MKVTKVETQVVVLPLDKPIGSALGQIDSAGCVLVSVHSDDGMVGENLVFTLNNRRTRLLRTMVEELADLIVGHDAGHIAGFWARAWKAINFFGHQGVTVMGISAIDGALWDAAGKRAGLPLYRLLGGAQDRVAGVSQRRAVAGPLDRRTGGGGGAVPRARLQSDEDAAGAGQPGGGHRAGGGGAQGRWARTSS